MDTDQFNPPIDWSHFHSRDNWFNHMTKDDRVHYYNALMNSVKEIEKQIPQNLKHYNFVDIINNRDDVFDFLEEEIVKASRNTRKPLD